jgi:hypothetical protein
LSLVPIVLVSGLIDIITLVSVQLGPMLFKLLMIGPPSRIYVHTGFKKKSGL